MTEPNQNEIFPAFASLQGLVMPFLGHQHPDDKGQMLSFVTSGHGEFLAHTDTPSVSARFNELPFGALVTFSANSHRDVLEVAKAEPPQTACLIGFSMRKSAYIGHNTQDGELIHLRHTDVVYPSKDGGLALGAHVTYHRHEAGHPHQVVVQSVPRPIGAWRGMADRAASAVFMARMVAAAGVMVAGDKLRNHGQKMANRTLDM